MTEKEFISQFQDAEFIRRTWPELQSSGANDAYDRTKARVVGLPSLNSKKSVRASSLLRIRSGSITVEFDTANPVGDAIEIISAMEGLS